MSQQLVIRDRNYVPCSGFTAAVFNTPDPDGEEPINGYLPSTTWLKVHEPVVVKGKVVGYWMTVHHKSNEKLDGKYVFVKADRFHNLLC